jgi:predicted GNAT family N-acyltransferase
VESKRITVVDDLKKAFQIRKEVFVREQGVSIEDEFDEFDTFNGLCEHILVYYNQQPAGTGRLRVVDGLGKLERICIMEPYRKFGLGKGIIKALMREYNKKKLPNMAARN